MEIKKIKCVNCGANLIYNSKKHQYECEYCKAIFIDEKDDDSPNPRVELTPADLKMLPKHFKNHYASPVIIIIFIIFFIIFSLRFSAFFISIFSFM